MGGDDNEHGSKQAGERSGPDGSGGSDGPADPDGSAARDATDIPGDEGPSLVGSSDDGYDIDDVLQQLEHLEAAVTSTKERHEVRRAKKMLQRVPGGRAIKKYTTRDIAEGFVGGIIFALPLLVEDGVFVIAEWFFDRTVAGVPVFFVVTVLFVVCMVTGLLYYTDIRDVGITRPIFGVVPRRLVGVLAISFLVATGTMLMWGRLHEAEPTTWERIGRVTVVWAAAAFGAALGDILPGESKGDDISALME